MRRPTNPPECGELRPIDQKLDTYTELDPETLQAAGGDDFWQPPIHGIDRDGHPIRPDVGISNDA